MASVRPNRPRRLAVQTIEKREVRIETRFVEGAINRGECEGVFATVEVAKLDARRTRIARRIGHDDVLDFWPPKAFEPDRDAAAGDDGLRDRGDQHCAIESRDDRRKRNFD